GPSGRPGTIRSRSARVSASLWPSKIGRTAARLRQVQPVRDRRRLRAAVDPELREDPGDVDARGLLGHEQCVPDLAVGGAFGNERQYLTLARSQPERILSAVALCRRRYLHCSVSLAPELEPRALDQRPDLLGKPSGAQLP